MDSEEAKNWYDGYELVEKRIEGRPVHFMDRPKPVVDAMPCRIYGTYWNQTEAHEALKA